MIQCCKCKFKIF